MKKGKYSGFKGFPKMYFFGVKKPLWNNMPHHILVIEKLGPDLGQLFYRYRKEYKTYKFSTKTVLMLAEQFLKRIKLLHEVGGYIHRDIKPENFLMGLGKYKTTVYMADFGLSRKNKEIYNDKKGYIQGTPIYASINTHLGISQSRRDDMESIGYVLMLFQSGTLPWLFARDDKNHKNDWYIIRDIKKQTTVENVCQGCYKEFHMYLHYCRGLRFDERPDYGYLMKLFRELFYRLGYKYDWRFDWTVESSEQHRPEYFSYRV